MFVHKDFNKFGWHNIECFNIVFEKINVRRSDIKIPATVVSFFKYILYFYMMQYKMGGRVVTSMYCNLKLSDTQQKSQ